MKNILIIGAGFAGLWSALSAVRQLDLHGRTDI
jgi:NADH dehydrogenase